MVDSQGKLLQLIPITARGDGQITLPVMLSGAGIYFYSLVVDGNILETKQVVLTK